jgi:hypothetical protein
MIRGSCLCSQVQFEVSDMVGPFELCHCNRCRKVSGSAFMAGIYAKREGFRFLKGRDLIKTFDVPISENPPYRSCFCGTCGSPMPDPNGDSALVEIPAGSLDINPGIKPDKHIFVEFKAPWFKIEDGLPRFDKVSLRKYRAAQAREQL